MQLYGAVGKINRGIALISINTVSSGFGNINSSAEIGNRWNGIGINTVTVCCKYADVGRVFYFWCSGGMNTISKTSQTVALAKSYYTFFAIADDGSRSGWTNTVRACGFIQCDGGIIVYVCGASGINTGRVFVWNMNDTAIVYGAGIVGINTGTKCRVYIDSCAVINLGSFFSINSISNRARIFLCSDTYFCLIVNAGCSGGINTVTSVCAGNVNNTFVQNRRIAVGGNTFVESTGRQRYCGIVCNIIMSSNSGAVLAVNGYKGRVGYFGGIRGINSVNNRSWRIIFISQNNWTAFRGGNCCFTVGVNTWTGLCIRYGYWTGVINAEVFIRGKNTNTFITRNINITGVPNFDTAGNAAWRFAININIRLIKNIGCI